MEESDPDSPAEHLLELVEEGANEDARAYLARLEAEGPADRKEALRELRRLADDRPTACSRLCGALTPYLTDDERPVRLTTTKLFVAVADGEPDAVVPAVSALAERLADEDEFYYVRARAAEALGYVALEHPDAVASPEMLADLRVGLSFDEPEVKAKLAKALEYVALGSPRRLRHQVSALLEHVADGNELVRYHLCTAATVVGCEYPAALDDVRAELSGRLGDENAFVRGRAAEAFGVLARADAGGASLPESALAALEDDDEPFVTARARFALSASTPRENRETTPDEIGTVEGIRETTADAVDELRSPDGDGACPNCGLALPEAGPPVCPQCGTPR
ncbi:HEAT repeat domain-containing protein [Halobaculum sp. P14]|uniref:HEAT repeat domain-containing protein n=1 Tax=Halobaculum sp. P14 TaxID=3421638 RepID=UPI003EC08C01